MRKPAPNGRKVTLAQLAMATYLMSSGGPYGIEELVQKSGYRAGLAILVLLPLLWSLPVGLMVGELSAAIPAEGGFYVWVKRALGPFWGFQEAWYSLLSSVFDLAVYPTLFVLSLGRLWPAATQGHNGLLIGAGMVLACVVWNLLGARAVGEGSLVMGCVLLSPFAILVGFAIVRGSIAIPAVEPVGPPDIFAGVLVAMWNYMGWDNASTIAGEVENPSRTYPRVMGLAIGLAMAMYVIPVLAMRYAGIPRGAWSTGSWISIASSVAGPWLGAVLLVTTMVSTMGSFNSLTLSYTRLPGAMAEAGQAPRIFARTLANGAPWLSILACGIAWTAALGLSFDRLLMLDILLYGASLVLEFVALAVLRVREPDLPRPFRIPGGLAGTVLVGVGPTALLVWAGFASRDEQIGGISALALGAAGIAAGGACYFLTKLEIFRGTVKDSSSPRHI